MSRTNHKTLLNLFHPNISESRGNKIIADELQKQCDLTFVDHYASYADFQIDKDAEQQKLRDHELIIWQFPFYWYSTPALLKQWQDTVLEYGFAYPPKEGKALHGKALLCVITTGGPADSYQSGEYNNFTFSELLRPLQQTAILCGMKWLRPRVINAVLPADYDGIKSSGDDAIKAFATETAEFINQYDISHERSLKPLNSPYFND